MPKTLTKKRQIKKAVKQLKKIIKISFHERQSRYCTFPGGGKAEGIEYYTKTKFGKLSIVIPPRNWNYRVPFLVALNHPENGKFTPNTELNIPIGLDRRVQTCLVEDGKNILICHRGGFTVGNGSLRQEQGLEFFRDWIKEIDDDGIEKYVIHITTLTQTSFADDIAHFASEVNTLKEPYRKVNTKK